MLNAGQHLTLALTGLAASLASRDPALNGLAADHAAAFAGLAGQRFGDDWPAVAARHGGTDLPLPRLTAALAAAGLPVVAPQLVLAIGLVEEEPRLAALLGDGRHATPGGLVACLRSVGGSDDPLAVKDALAQALRLGLVVSLDPARPRLDQPLGIPAPLWDALSGSTAGLPGARLLLPGTTPTLAGLVLTDQTRRAAASAAAVMNGDQLLVLRGPSDNGRRSLACAIAAAAGRPVLEAEPALASDAAAWTQAGLLAAITGAALLVAPTLGPGETLALPPLPLSGVPLIVALERSGSVDPGGRSLLGLALPAPDAALRTQLWQAALPCLDATTAAALATPRLAAGTIMRTAPAALLTARAANRDLPTQGDVAAALAETPDPRLEGLATRVSLSGHSERPQLDSLADTELDALARRCTLREALADHAGAGPGGLGVRALFSGPSGTGKTMAARHLARLLGRELWRIDLAAVVSKYIGETEKALDRALAAAESRDIILLLDEGDALMARRTDVGNANDRYANLETNFLLQRLEDFSGIIIVTTNAADRIDTAFARRMDVVVPFRPPDAPLRAAILKGLLAGSDVSSQQLVEVAARCTLTGGQLRNIGLHARLMGLCAGRLPGDADLLQAVTREYRKDGGHSPLKPSVATTGSR